jgi:hypothetical protein
VASHHEHEDAVSGRGPARAHKIIPLCAPILHEDKEITQVALRRPKVRDLKALNAALEGVKDQLDQGIVLAATLTGLPVEVIEELDADDFTAISEVMADFFPQGTASPNGAVSLPKPPTG